jgi:hypothetical protein
MTATVVPNKTWKRCVLAAVRKCVFLAVRPHFVAALPHPGALPSLEVEL